MMTAVMLGCGSELPGEAPRPEEASGPVALADVPSDGRLYAAAGSVVITPTEENHPCPHYLGGTGQNRLSEGVHTDLEARALILAQGDVNVVLASLDLVGWEVPDSDRVIALLEPHGIDGGHVVLSSTHTHNGPDTIGVWGPGELETGRCEHYNLWLARTVADLVVDISGRLVPVTLRATEATIDVPGSDFPDLVNDWRMPRVTNDHFTVAGLTDDEGGAVATLINWHTHPESMIHENVYTADFPHWTRRAVERELGGTCVYFSGTVGGLQTCMTVDVPARDDAGEPVMDERGEPVWIDADGPEKERSLGYFVADFALSALAEAPVIGGTLSVATERAEIPFENIMMIFGVQSGVIEPYPGIVEDDPSRCGMFGCMPWLAHHVGYGRLHVVDLPGELFPESSVGRPASEHDYSDEGDGTWGVRKFPAMTGYRAALPEGDLLFELGLANQELGYLVPESDMLPGSHPGNYEEYFCVSPKAEALVRETVRDLLE